MENGEWRVDRSEKLSSLHDRFSTLPSQPPIAMMDLEKDLRQALRAEEPSADFTDRVMARVAQLPAKNRQEKERKNRAWLKRFLELFQPPPARSMKWAMAGAMICLLALAGLELHRERERERLQAIEIAEGEKAKEQVLLAMRIASAKLNVAQKKVLENSER